MTQATGSGEVDILYIDVQLRSDEAEKSLRELETVGEKAGGKAGTATGEEIASKLKATSGKLETAGKQLGDSVTDGMAQGVKSGASKVESAADNAAKGIKGKLKSGLSGAFDALDGAGISNTITDIGGALTGAVSPAALLTVGLTAVAAAGAFIGSSINVYADLEKELNTLKAVSGATADEMGHLKDQALELGQSTTYSATEVLTVQQELSKAGVSISDILGGATQGTLLLASATGSELPQALDVATKAMNVFNLSGKDVAHIADVISNGANQSALDVGSFGTALQALGKVGPQAGLGLEQTTAVLSVFADNALEGSDAGTSLKTMLLALLAPSDKVASQLEAMGVNVYESHNKLNELGVSIKDSEGNLRPFAAIISDLNTRFRGMSDEQRNAAMSTIFGSDAVRAASILYDEGSGKLFDYTTKMYASGTAAENAKTRQEGLRGAQEQLGGAMQTLQANVGQFFTPAMTAITVGATTAITAVSDLFGWLDRLANGTALDQLNGNVAKFQTELTGLQEAITIGEQQLKAGNYDNPHHKAQIEGQLTAMRDEAAQLQLQIASAQSAVNKQAGTEEAQRQDQPGWQGPRMGPQDRPSGAGVFSALGVGRFQITQELGENPQNPAYKPFAGKPFAGHEGVDIATPSGTAIEAPFTGMLQAKTSAAYGKYLELVDEKGQKLILAHLSAYASGLEAQIKAAGGRLLVSTGQQIGLTGNTGNSTGPHLHVGGVTTDGRYVDARSLDYAGMAKPTFKPGTGVQGATDWDKLIAKAKELKSVFDSAKPGTQAAILASNNINAFKKSSDAAKEAYAEIERAAGIANKKIKETDAEREQRLYREKVAQDAMTVSLHGASDARLQELSAQGISGQSLQKWEAVKAEIARREKDRAAQAKRDAADATKDQAEATRNAEAASKQADALASKAAGGAAEAARLRSQSLTTSRELAIRAAGDNLGQVLAIQTAYAPKLVAAAEQEGLATLKARKLTNDQWRATQEEAARKTITNQTELAVRLKAIESGWRTENGLAYTAYYAALGRASTDSALVVEQAGTRVAEAAAKKAQAVNDARYQPSSGLVRYSFGEGEGGLTAALKAYGVKDVSDVQAALAELNKRAPKTAALIREAYASEIAQLVFFSEQFNASAAETSQQSIDRIRAAQEEGASYGETLTMLTDLLGGAIGEGIDPRQSGYLNVLDGLIEKGGEAAAAALYVKTNLDQLLDKAGATDLGTILYRGQKAIQTAQDANNAPAPEGTTLAQSTANSVTGQVLSDVFSGAPTEQLTAAINASLSDAFNQMGADGREEFWGRFGDLSGSSEYQTALNGLSSVQLSDLIDKMGSAPEWADLKKTLTAKFAEAVSVPAPEANPVEDYLQTVINSANDAKTALDAGLIDPSEYAGKIGPLITSLAALAVNLDRVGKTDAASSVRALISAMSETTSGIGDPAALATASALAASTYQQAVRLNSATVDSDRAAYRERLAQEVKFWEDRVAVLQSIGGPAYLAAVQKLAELKNTYSDLSLNVTVKVFGIDTGIKQLDVYKTALTGLANIIQQTFSDLTSGASKTAEDVVKSFVVMALGVVQQIAMMIAAQAAYIVATALIDGATLNPRALLTLAAAAAVAGIAAGLASQVKGAGAATSTTSSASAPPASQPTAESPSKNLVDIPNSAVTVIAAPSWVADMGQHIDRMGAYINRLVTEGIHVSTDKGSTSASVSSLSWDLNGL